MATSLNSRAGDELGGWPPEIFEPGEEAKAKALEFTCAICCLVMREPTSLGCSSDHALCRTCAERLAQQAGVLKCPIDREVVDRVRFQPSRRDGRRIDDLKVHCRFQMQGCEWRGDLGSLATHAERCAAGWSACGCCRARVLVDDLPAHEAACRRPCPNAQLGCTAHLSVSDRDAHLGTCLRDLVVRLTRDHACEKGALERRVADLSEQLAEMQRRVEAAEREKRELACGKGALERRVADLSEQLAEMQRRVEAAEREKRELACGKGALEQRVADLSEQHAEMQRRVEAAEREKRELARGKGTLEQRVADLSEQLAEMQRRVEAAEREKRELACGKGTLEQRVADLSEQLAEMQRRVEAAEREKRELARGKGALQERFEDLMELRPVEDMPEFRAVKGMPQLRVVRHRPALPVPEWLPLNALAWSEPSEKSSASPAAATASIASGAATGGDTAPPTGPSELQVAPGESISAAVRRAAPGQTIRLAPGLYREKVVLSRDVHLVGSREAVLELGEAPALTCAGTAAPSVRGISIRNTGHWKNFTAVEIYGGSRALVEGCDVSSAGVGIQVKGEETAPTLRGNTVHSCCVGINFSSSAKGVAEGNDVHGNSEVGISIGDLADPVVRGNRIHDQKEGVAVYRNGKGTIEGNTYERISVQSFCRDPV
eukprot:tig00001694_g9572.t1